MVNLSRWLKPRTKDNHNRKLVEVAEEGSHYVLTLFRTTKPGVKEKSLTDLSQKLSRCKYPLVVFFYSTRRAKQAVCIPNLNRLKMWQRVGVPSHKAEVPLQEAS